MLVAPVLAEFMDACEALLLVRAPVYADWVLADLAPGISIGAGPLPLRSDWRWLMSRIDLGGAAKDDRESL